MHVQDLGHVVLKVRDLERSERFYSDVLGMGVILRIPDPPMTFFRLANSENHHDFALMEVPSQAAAAPDQKANGLAHVAFKVGDSTRELCEARSSLNASGTRFLYEADRAFAKSMHVLDPDGNEIELYVETLGHSEG